MGWGGSPGAVLWKLLIRGATRRPNFKDERPTSGRQQATGEVDIVKSVKVGARSDENAIDAAYIRAVIASVDVNYISPIPSNPSSAFDIY